MQRLERPGFALDMPAWRVVDDQAGAGQGLYKVGDPAREVAEVSWLVGPPASMAELELLAEQLRGSAGMRALESTPREFAGGRELRTTMAMADVWLGISLVQCDAAEVMLTVGVTSRDRALVESLRERVLAKLTCGPAGSAAQDPVWPASDLPPSFGAFVDGSLGLGDGDGRWLLVAVGPVPTIRAVHERPYNRDVVLGMYAEIFQARFEPRGEAKATRTWTGDPAETLALGGSMGPLVMTTFVCEPLATGFIVFAGHDGAAPSHEALEALSLRVGCPRDGDADILARPSACEVGSPVFCEQPGGAAPE